MGEFVTNKQCQEGRWLLIAKDHCHCIGKCPIKSELPPSFSVISIRKEPYTGTNNIKALERVSLLI